LKDGEKYFSWGSGPSPFPTLRGEATSLYSNTALANQNCIVLQYQTNLLTNYFKYKIKQNSFKFTTKITVKPRVSYYTYLEKKQLMRKHRVVVAIEKDKSHKNTMNILLNGVISPACKDTKFISQALKFSFEGKVAPCRLYCSFPCFINAYCKYSL